jgi:hypothetical protein
MAVQGILFRPEMVLAIERGLKTQTRRLMKPQPTHRIIEGMGHITIGMDPADDGAVWYDADCIHPGREVRCPYGRIGNRLRVLTTWAVNTNWDSYRPVNIGHNIGDFWHAGMGPKPKEYGKSRPGRFCPSFLRHFLPLIELTDIRPQRLQDITEEDSEAEGVYQIMSKPHKGKVNGKSATICVFDKRLGFSLLWDTINPKHLWSSNPWVFALSFTQV